MPRSNKPNLEQQFATTDDREPQKRVVKNAIRKLRTKGPAGGESFTVQVLPNGLAAIKRMARNGLSKGSIAHALGIGLDKLNQALRDQPEAADALSVGLAGLEDELSNILLHHARQKDGKTSLIAAIYLSKARCGWRDGGEPVTHKTNNVVIHLPDSKSPEQWMRELPALTAPKGESE